jgi:CHAD domain-containing protein
MWHAIFLPAIMLRDMDLGHQHLAAKYIRRQVVQLAKQLDGVRAAEDIEFVHRARVATRRLRASLAMFRQCFARKKVKRWRKAIRLATKSLGHARDRDVQIEWLCGALSALNTKECFPGIAHVLVQLEHERERFQRHVVKAVDRLEASGVLQEMRRETRKTLDAASEPDHPQTQETCRQIKQHVLRQLGELLQYEPFLADPGDRVHHHAMRIAAKRLRYMLEIASSICPGRLDEGVETIKRLQTLLGDIHDCDVWLDHLDSFASSERDRIIEMFGHAGRFLHLKPGIEHLRKDRQEHRQATFEELGRYWDELKGRGFLDELAGAVELGTANNEPEKPAEGGQDGQLGMYTESHG